MIRAVIFDVDGTLVDSVDLHARAWQETFREFGKDFPFKTFACRSERVPPTYPGVFERGGIGGLWKTHLQPAWEDFKKSTAAK
jgi:phosphoglycolate phosphatase-like HAD superfamily hydrolase